MLGKCTDPSRQYTYWFQVHKTHYYVDPTQPRILTRHRSFSFCLFRLLYFTINNVFDDVIFIWKSRDFQRTRVKLNSGDMLLYTKTIAQHSALKRSVSTKWIVDGHWNYAVVTCVLRCTVSRLGYAYCLNLQPSTIRGGHARLARGLGNTSHCSFGNIVVAIEKYCEKNNTKCVYVCFQFDGHNIALYAKRGRYVRAIFYRGAAPLGHRLYYYYFFGP